MTTNDEIICKSIQNDISNNTYVKNRLEIVSPYPLYDEYELNMRRKAEILKYNNNKNISNTKKQKNANSLKGYKQYNILTNNCEYIDELKVYKPSYYSNVPGNTLLYYNKNIPLYKYNSSNYSNTYSFLNYTYR